MSENIAEHSGAVHRHDFAVLLRWLFIAAIVVALVAVAMDNRKDCGSATPSATPRHRSGS